MGFLRRTHVISESGSWSSGSNISGSWSFDYPWSGTWSLEGDASGSWSSGYFWSEL